MMARLTIFHSKLPKEVRRQSLRDREKIARNIAADARAAAPVLTGEYRDGISVDTQGTLVKVVDNDDTALHKEYGTSDTPAHAALTNAASSYGRYSGTRPR